MAALVPLVLAAAAGAGRPDTRPPVPAPPVLAGGAPAETRSYPFSGGVYTLPEGVELAEDRLLVRFRKGVTRAAKASARAAADAELAEAFELVPGLELLEVGPGENVLDVVAELERDPRVEYAQPDLLYELQATTPNDPRLGEQWALEAIRAPEAWDRGTGSPSVVVAVLDTGIALGHEDLAANLWVNPGEIAGNGIDDDGNGYVDDVHGWNFLSSGAPHDDVGHGSHVAGIVGAAGDNATGISGVNWSVGIMPLKICQQFCSLSAEVAALEYAVEKGAKVVNASFGGFYGGTAAEEDAIAAAGAAGVLYVAAAGNDANDNDVRAVHPAGYDLPNIVSVAATTSEETLATFSNYGATSVDLAAPGHEILSTVPGGYESFSGTSMAAPHVAGGAALLWSQNPTWTLAEIRSRLLATARPVDDLAGKVSSCGQLDLAAAADPAVVAGQRVCVVFSGTGHGTVSFSPGADPCSDRCVVEFAAGTEVTLTASASPGSTFAGWSGACSGTASCVIPPAAAPPVRAVFRSEGSPPGWSQAPLAAPAGSNPAPEGADVDLSFYNLSLSDDATVRAKTVYTFHGDGCYFDTSDTGGVFVERRTAAAWIPDGVIRAPTLGTDVAANWANCFHFGAVTELSGDGSSLLIVPDHFGAVFTPELGFHFRCAAFVYRRGASAWELDGTLFPPGLDETGSLVDADCRFFAEGGTISNDGGRVAVMTPSHTLVYARGEAGWELEESLALPQGESCANSITRRQIAISGDGTRLLRADLGCGRVYEYSRTGAGWTLTDTIETPEPGVPWNEFGRALALSDDGSTLAITALRADDLPLFAGAVWVYERTSAGWVQRTRLTAPAPSERAVFTCSSVVRGGARLVCGTVETVGYNEHQGAVYVFDRPAAGWTAPAPPVRMFATEGVAIEHLGATLWGGLNHHTVPESGGLIGATISFRPATTGEYPDDRIGYEFLSSPVVTTSTLFSGAVDVPYSQTLAATEGLGPYTWALDSGSLPAGLTLASDGTISGTPTALGSSTFTVRVNDDLDQTATKELSIEVTPLPLPYVTTTSLPVGIVGDQYSKALAAANGSPPYAWTLDSGSLPAGLTLGPDGTITGTPTAPGSSTFTVRVTDGLTQTDTQELSITVVAPLGVTTSGLPGGFVGVPYLQALAAGGGTPPYTWKRVSGSLPAGLTLTPSGTISGEPSTVGSSSFTVRVADARDQFVTRELTIDVSVLTAPAITTASVPGGVVGVAYSHGLAASGGAPPYTWTLQSHSLVPGLTLGADGVISGIPTAPGFHMFSVRVTDDLGQSVTKELSIAVLASVDILTTALPSGLVGSGYLMALTAAGGAPPYTWTLDSGALPGGVTLGPEGVVAGIPSAAGTFPFTVRVTDSIGLTDTQALSLTIIAQLEITTTSLSPVTAGQAYSQTLQATGGTPPYGWSLAAGSLPAGLALNQTTGAITGTPTQSGSFPVTVQVSDAGSVVQTRTRPLTIVVNAAPAPPVAPAPAPKPAPTRVTARPAGAVVETGSRRAGSAASLAKDDNVYFAVASTAAGTRTASWYGRFTRVPRTLSSLRVTYTGKSSQTCAQTVSIWRWSTRTWVRLASRSVGTKEVSLANLAPGGAASAYVSGSGELRARVRCTRPSSAFVSSGDLLLITYLRP